MESFSERLISHKSGIEQAFMESDHSNLSLMQLENLSDSFHISCEDFSLADKNVKSSISFIASNYYNHIAYQNLLGSFYLMASGLYNPAIGQLRIALENKLCANAVLKNDDLAGKLANLYQKKHYNFRIEWRDILSRTEGFWYRQGLDVFFKTLCGYVHASSMVRFKELNYTDDGNLSYPIYGETNGDMAGIAVGYWIRVSTLLDKQQVVSPKSFKINLSLVELCERMWNWSWDKGHQLHVLNLQTDEYEVVEIENIPEVKSLGLHDILEGILPICPNEIGKITIITGDNKIPLPVLNIKAKIEILDAIIEKSDNGLKKEYKFLRKLSDKEKFVNGKLSEAKTQAMKDVLKEWFTIQGYQSICLV